MPENDKNLNPNIGNKERSQIKKFKIKLESTEKKKKTLYKRLDIDIKQHEMQKFILIFLEAINKIKLKKIIRILTIKKKQIQTMKPRIYQQKVEEDFISFFKGILTD